jgi:hypothetical protein
VAPLEATKVISRYFAACITTSGQAALFKESRAYGLHSYIPSVIAHLPVLLSPKLYFRSN